MGRKSTLDKELVIKLYIDGMNYKAIADELNSKEDTIRKCIKNNNPEVLEPKLDKKLAIKLYTEGLTYRAIAAELNSREDTVRMCIKNHAPEEIVAKKEAKQNSSYKLDTGNEYIFEIESSNRLDATALTEIREEGRWGINNNEGMSTGAFIKACCVHSYKSDLKSGRAKFDKSRGARTQDVPPSYKINGDEMSKFRLSILSADGIEHSITVRAYDDFDARLAAKGKIKNWVFGQFKIVGCAKVL